MQGYRIIQLFLNLCRQQIFFVNSTESNSYLNQLLQYWFCMTNDNFDKIGESAFITLTYIIYEALVPSTKVVFFEGRGCIFMVQHFTHMSSTSLKRQLGYKKIRISHKQISPAINEILIATQSYILLLFMIDVHNM